VPRPLKEGATIAEKDDCSKFWEEFDNNTEPGKLALRKPPLPKNERDQRRRDVEEFMREIGFPFIGLVYARATGDKAAADKIDKEIQLQQVRLKPAIKRLSDIQNEVMKKHFPPKKAGDEIDFERFQRCVEFFANGDLGERHMDSRDMWLIWLAFAKAAAKQGVKKWEKIEISLLKGAVIDFSFPQERRINDPKTGKVIIDPAKRLKPADVDKIRERIEKGSAADRTKEENKLMAAVVPEEPHRLAVAATGPHPAEAGRTQIAVALATAQGRLVPDAAIEVYAVESAIVVQSTAESVTVRPEPMCEIYRTELAWPAPADVFVYAVDRRTGARNFTSLAFDAPS
jgi:hypothetical protein